MAFRTVSATLLLSCSASSTDVTPIQRVLDMMNDMLAKGKSEKHDEEVEFNKFSVWCDSTRDETTTSIKQAADKIVQLNADIAKAEADAEQLKEEITTLEADISTASDELKSATEIRNKENADYKATHADLSESVDAIERAIGVLKSQSKDTAQASLLQIQNMQNIPQRAKIAIESFLALDASADASAPEANAYEFQSGGIVAMLEKMKLKFEDQRLAVEKAEISQKSNYEVLAQQLNDDIKAMTKSVAKKTEKKAQRLEDAATAKGDLEITTAAKAEDEKKLSDTNAECSARSEEYEKNQVLRAEEIVAITAAQKILQSGSVSGNADKHLPSFVQVSSFAQLRSSSQNDVRHRVIDLLQSRSKKLGSRYLALVASHAADDPFAKVKKMIKDLIVKLMEEANAEADHKGYCDTELATNKQTREIKSAEVEDLTAQIEKNTADISQLSEDITTLSDEIAEISAQQAEATKIRDEEKAKNAVTIADAKEAQGAVEKAIQVLKDFYAKAAEAALIQGQEGLGSEMAQATHAPYKGMGSGGGNLVDFLDVILSDFARLESETTTAEDQSASSHEQFMNETNEDKAVKDTELKHKQGKKDQTSEITRNLKKELELTQEELDAALKYYEKLKPDCVDQGLSYEDRVAQREQEIQSLQEALKMLSGEDLA